MTRPTGVERLFVAAIRANRADDAPWLQFQDFLLEQGREMGRELVWLLHKLERLTDDLRLIMLCDARIPIDGRSWHFRSLIDIMLRGPARVTLLGDGGLLAATVASISPQFKDEPGMYAEARRGILRLTTTHCAGLLDALTALPEKFLLSQEPLAWLRLYLGLPVPTPAEVRIPFHGGPLDGQYHTTRRPPLNHIRIPIMETAEIEYVLREQRVSFAAGGEARQWHYEASQYHDYEDGPQWQIREAIALDDMARQLQQATGLRPGAVFGIPAVIDRGRVRPVRPGETPQGLAYVDPNRPSRCTMRTVGPDGRHSAAVGVPFDTEAGTPLPPPPAPL